MHIVVHKNFVHFVESQVWSLGLQYQASYGKYAFGWCTTVVAGTANMPWANADSLGNVFFCSFPCTSEADPDRDALTGEDYLIQIARLGLRQITKYMAINWPCFSHSRVDKKAQQTTSPTYAALLSAAAAAAAAAARRQLWFGGGGVPKVMAAASRPAWRGSLFHIDSFPIVRLCCHLTVMRWQGSLAPGRPVGR